METFEYTDGSEKQNAWASKIAQEAMAKYNLEIHNQELRPSSDGMSKYIEILKGNRKKLVAGFGKITARQLIDMFVAKRIPIDAMIEQSRKEYTRLKNDHNQ